jgi:fatty-acyl-CoA synthase
MTVPVVDISPATAFHEVVRRQPSAVSLVDEQASLTAAQVLRRYERLAADLAARGVGAGDRVAYLGRNSAAVLLTALACAHLGAVFVPVNFRLAVPEVRAVLRQCRARAAVVAPELAELGRALADQLPLRLTCPDDDAPGAPVPARVARTFDDLAVLMYTSGTTGRPKGVMLTHGNLWWSATAVDEVFDTRADDVTLAVAPLFHIGGLNAFTLRTLVRGGTVLVRRSFDAQRTLDDLTRGVTTLFGVPAMFAAVARRPAFATADLSGVRAAIVAGAPVPPELVRRYADRGLLLQQSWGMTETAPSATFVPAHRTRDKAGSAGLPLPRTRIRLVDPQTGATVTGPGQAGEIQVAGPTVTPGYWDDLAGTRAAFTDDDWLRSGDLAEWDDEGYLTVVGRLKDMINSGGENIYPVEVEAALAGLPGVTDAVVLGAPDCTWGETVVAVLEHAGPSAPTLEQVQAHAAASIARYKLPRHVVVVPELPRTATGKVDCRALRALVDQHVGSAPVPR